MSIDFTELWNSYPSDYSPCRIADGQSAFDNQCAIRVGIALVDGGVNLSSYTGVRCWHGHGGKHILRGEELVQWLNAKPDLFGDAEVRSGTDESYYFGRRGIIFCQNFWGAGNQGDHIDLWNLNEMHSGSWDYIRRSERVHFWTIDATTTEFMNRLDPNRSNDGH
jgi:hypothetical protein